MLSGIWILVLLPLMSALNTFWPSCLCVPVPTIFDFRGGLTLNETHLTHTYEPLVFCMGVVLLFSKERGRRPSPLDWTRRWGVLCSYVVLLLSAAQVLFFAALVLTGIAALFLSMPPRHQPEVTQLFVNVSWVYLHYGLHPGEMSSFVLIAFSSIAVLLACVPIFDALRSSGPKWVAVSLLAPLVLLSVMHLAQVGWHCLGISRLTWVEVFVRQVYFSPALLVSYLAPGPAIWFSSASSLSAFIVEATKWCIVLAIAVWLSIAQLVARWQGKKTSAA